MQHSFFIRLDKKNVRVNFKDILYVEARRNYVNIVTADKNYLALLALHMVEKMLPANVFCQVHRSFIVSMDYVTAFDATTVWLNNIQLPVGEQYREALPSRVHMLVCDTRHQPDISRSTVVPIGSNLMQAAN